jgi:hypothetical protein
VFFVLIDIYERNRPGRYIIENESVLWENKKKQQPWEWDFFLNVMPFNFCFFNVCFVSCFLFSYVFVLFVFVCFSSLTVASLTREKKIDTTKAKNIELRVKENGKKKLKLFFFAIYESQFLLTFFFTFSSTWKRDKFFFFLC